MLKTTSMKRIFTLLLLACTLIFYAQGRKPLQGRVTIGNLTATQDEVQINNINSKKITSTLNNGYFTIAAKAGDTLRFSGPEFPAVKYLVKPTDISEELLEFQVSVEGTQLSQVTVEAVPTSKSVGLEPSDSIRYTPAERKLKNARSTRSSKDPDKAYTAIGTDPVINAISGRTKDLKKQVVVEKKEKGIAKLQELHPDEYYIGTLKIPADYVRGFMFYAVEDAKFLKTLDTNNEEEIDFQLSTLATKYKKELKNGKK